MVFKMMIWKIKVLYWKVRNLIRLVPIIWKDEQWDESYVFKLLAFKFKLMEDFYNSKYAISADSKKVASEVRVCRLLCNRLITNDYDEMLDVEWEWETEDILPICYGCHTIGWIADRWMDYEMQMRHQDLALLCKLIEKHAFTWWD